MKHTLFLLALVCLGAALAQGQQCAPPNYCAYAGTDIRTWPTLPNMGAQIKSGLVWTDSSLPSSHPSRVVRCTDQLIEPDTTIANQSKSAGLGGSGDAEQLFNSNSTMLRFNTSGGRGHITLFNPTTLTCGDPFTGYVITAIKNNLSPGSATADYDFGAGTFDWTDAGAGAGNSIYYGFNSGHDAPLTGFAKYVISRNDGTFTVTTPFLSFQPGLPIGVQAPAWQSSHAYSQGDYVSFTLTLGDWNGLTSYIVGDLIRPQTNNPAGCAFKLITVGTRGTLPTWSSGSCTVSANVTEVSGTETWKNIGNDGTFLFQLTSSGGTSQGSAPNFATASGHPDLASTVTDNTTLTWTNVGLPIVPNHTTFGGVSKDSTRFCAGGSSNTYGGASIPNGYTGNNGGQGSDTYAFCYDSVSNTFVLLNSVTGIQSVVTCSGGTGYTCNLGTQSKLTSQGAGATAVTGGCPFFIHNVKNGSTADYVVVASQQAISGTCPIIASGSNLLFAWQPFAAYSASTVLQAFNTASSHWTIGKSLLVNYAQSALNFGFTTGVYGIVLNSTNPGAAATTNWQVGAPFTSSCDGSGVWAPNDSHPPCNFPSAYDSHLAFWHDALDDDTGPSCGTIYDGGGGYANPVAAWQNEEVCISVTPTWTPPAAIGAYTVWRFTHTFCTLTNPFFDGQFCISQLSTDGKFLAFTSDWDGTLGDISGGSSATFGLMWHPSTPYTSGTNLNPFQSLTGGGSNYGVWQVTSNGTSAAGLWGGPTCGTGNVGATYNDGSIGYSCVGPATDKTEVFITDMTGMQLSVASRVIRAVQ
jgi:hypothetical protein